MPTLYKNLGFKVKKLREEIDISQSSLAEALGVDRVTISKIENGERKIYAEEIKKLSEYFNISSDVLLDLKEDIEVIIEKNITRQEPKKEIRISVPQKNLQKFKEVTYNYAYLAMLRCGRSIVFMKGYRSVDGQQHKTIIELSGDVLGEKFKNIIKKFDHMRRKRNQFTYDPFLPVSKIEAENALKTAEEFVKIVLKLVQKENPQLRFNFNK
ncbi:unnamed protein product [marine sediment metagenome]|uniref:HTH cro/C1-type domain-containing protein n=1 Tax=marine sediment metagenome TaxID=412755 RepID=X1FBK0_9ZZZZ